MKSLISSLQQPMGNSGEFFFEFIDFEDNRKLLTGVDGESQFKMSFVLILRKLAKDMMSLYFIVLKKRYR